MNVSSNVDLRCSTTGEPVETEGASLLAEGPFRSVVVGVLSPFPLATVVEVGWSWVAVAKSKLSSNAESNVNWFVEVDIVLGFIPMASSKVLTPAMGGTVDGLGGVGGGTTEFRVSTFKKASWLLASTGEATTPKTSSNVVFGSSDVVPAD
jgi:hypothetical protein